jgi:hypothetical protein
MGFINGTDNECYDSVPLQVQENQWKRDNTKIRPGSGRIVTKDDGRVVAQKPIFSQLLVENQKKLSGNDRLYFNSRRMGTMWGTKFSEGEV